MVLAQTDAFSLSSAQVDSGFWQGSALLAAVVGGVAVSSEEQRKAAVAATLNFYRACGLQTAPIEDIWVPYFGGAADAP